MRSALLVSLVLAVAATASAGTARPGAQGPSLTALRICEGTDQVYGECQHDQRLLPLYPEVRCSVRVYAPKPTRLRARLFYDGQLQRSTSAVVHGRRTRAIAVAFESLGDDESYGAPGGRYTCEFAVGGVRRTVSGTSRGPREQARVPAACAVHGAGSRVCPYDDVEVSWPRSLSCSVVLVKYVGHTATTELRRNERGEWRTLYEASDRVTVPIAEVWAYTSASPERFFPSGDYRCRFSVDGAVVAEHRFTVRS